MLQSRTLKKSILKEQSELNKYLKIRSVNAIISDNRYGIFSNGIPSILITHQLKLTKETPLRFFAQRILNRQYKNFNHIWIPDEQNSLLSGELSNSELTNTKFIGVLSRLENLALQRKKHILIIASGTEPHRTQFENKMISKLGNSKYECVLIRGLFDKNPIEKVFPKNFQILHSADSQEVNGLMNNCSLVISRIGYSTVMDVFKTQTPVVFITTKGQSEQEYLAKHLSNTTHVNSVPLKDFTLKDVNDPKTIAGKSQVDLKKFLRTWLSKF